MRHIIIVALLAASALACTRSAEVPAPAPPPPVKSDYQLCAERVGKEYVVESVKNAYIARFCGYPAGGKP